MLEIPSVLYCLQCFDAVGLAEGSACGLQKNSVVGCWHGYLSGTKCRFAYDPADANTTHYLLLQQIQTGFTFLILAHPGGPRRRAVKWVF